MSGRDPADDHGGMNNGGMNADQLLDAARTATLAVAVDGTVLAARGGFGGFVGVDLAATVGTNVFTRLPAADADELATYFIENAGEADDTVTLPVPFRISILDDRGEPHLVDVIATGCSAAAGPQYWVVVLVPVALSASVTRSLDLEMSGADRDSVKRMLCEELALDNADYTSRWLLLDFSASGDTRVIHAGPDEATLADAVLADVRDGWCPWQVIEPGHCAPVPPDGLPPTMRSVMAARGWRRTVVAPVHVGGRLVAALLLVGRVPAAYPLDVVKRNIAVRTQGLVNATALLMERWEEQDQLRADATSDALTGLGNSRALATAMADSHRPGAVLFVDIDHFKAVNDDYGHRVGDDVLVVVARRIVASCREGDVVVRFGGDEFVVLLDGADEELAASIGWRIVEAVSAPLEIDGGPERISVSVGLSPRCTVDALDAADRAMLDAKRSGRARLAMAASD